MGKVLVGEADKRKTGVWGIGEKALHRCCSITVLAISY